MSQSIPFEPNKIISAFDREHRLERYIQLLLEENRRVNLVSRETGEVEALIMAAESLLPLQFLPDQVESYLDIGSGGGLPAVPLILSGKVSGRSTLIEGIQKKCSALNRMLIALGLVAEVIPERFPSAETGGMYDLVSLRWVKLEPALLSQIGAVLSETGRFVHYSQEPMSSDIFSSETFLYDDPQTGVTKGFTLYQKC